jgi:hypothetical protein
MNGRWVSGIDDAPLPVSHMALSRNGRRLLTITAAANRILSYWDLDTLTFIAESPVRQPFGRSDRYSGAALLAQPLATSSTPSFVSTPLTSIHGGGGGRGPSLPSSSAGPASPRPADMAGLANALRAATNNANATSMSSPPVIISDDSKRNGGMNINTSIANSIGVASSMIINPMKIDTGVHHNDDDTSNDVDDAADIFVSFNPSNDREWCTGHGGAVTMWRFESRFGVKHLQPMYVGIASPKCSAPCCSSVNHLLPYDCIIVNVDWMVEVIIFRYHH